MLCQQLYSRSRQVCLMELPKLLAKKTLLKFHQVETTYCLNMDSCVQFIFYKLQVGIRVHLHEQNCEFISNLFTPQAL